MPPCCAPAHTRSRVDPAATKEAADFIYHETRRLESLSGKLLALLGLESDDAVEPAPVSDRALFAALARSLPPAEGVDLRFETRRLHRLRRPHFVGGSARKPRPQRLPGLPRPDRGRVVVACRAEGDSAVFTVADNGCGIRPPTCPA